MGDGGYFMPAAPIKTGIGDIQQFGDKGWIPANDIPNFFGGGSLVPAQLQHLQGQGWNGRKCFTVFYSLKNLGIHNASDLLLVYVWRPLTCKFTHMSTPVTQMEFSQEPATSP